MPRVRVRKTDDSFVYNSRRVVVRSANGTIVQDYIDTQPLRTVPHNYSYMSDIVGNRGGYNPLSHHTLIGDFKLPGSYKYNDDAIETDTPIYVAHALPAPYDSIPEVLMPLEPSGALLSEWSSEAFNAFHDQIPTQVSVANFLFELRDIKGLIPKIVKKGSRISSKTISSNFLALEFGWKPMLDDIKKIMNLTVAVDKRLKHLKATYGKTVSLSFKRDFASGAMPALSPESYTRTHDGTGVRRFTYERVSYSCDFRITGKLFQKLEGLDDIATHMKALAAATGFNNPAAIVWEAIPFSFVVDWLFSLDSIIGKMAIQPFGGEWTISNVGYSVKQTAVYNVYQDFLVGAPWGNEKTLLGTLRMKGYIRRPGFPLTCLFITDGSLTPKQQVLSLALLNELRR